MDGYNLQYFKFKTKSDKKVYNKQVEVITLKVLVATMILLTIMEHHNMI